MKFVRRLRRYWPFKVGLTLVLLVYAAWPGHSTFTVSPETTYVTEPLDAEGYVDYPTALNTRLKKDITPAQNATVLIVKALGPRPEGAPLLPDFYRWLEIEPLPDQGDYFVAPDDFYVAHYKPAIDASVWLLPTRIEWKKLWEENQSTTRRWPWKRGEFPAVAEWLDANQKPLALIEEASKLAHYFHPMISKSNEPHNPRIMGSLLPSVQKCRALTNALVARAMLRTGDGQFDAAWQDLMVCQRLGRLVMRGATLIEALVGIAIANVATNAQIVFLAHAEPSQKQASKWLADLHGLPPLSLFADKLDLGERFFCLDSLQSIACFGDHEDFEGGIGQSRPRSKFWDRLFTRSIDWDPAFRNANNMYDRYSAAARLTPRSKRKSEFQLILDDFTQANKTARARGVFGKMFSSSSDRGEHIGNVLIELLMPALDRVQNAFDRAEQIQQNLRIAFALTGYRAEHKHYPKSLDLLTPKILSAVPEDLFAEAPLKYRRYGDGYILYSVGVNEIDEKGRGPREEEDGGDDLSVRMPVKPLVRQ